MMDVEDFQLNGREVGKLHFWEMQAGALEQSIISEMAEENMDAGFVVVYHYPLTETSFDVHMRIRLHLFSENEIRMLEENMS